MRPVRRSDNLTRLHVPCVLNLGASTSWNPQCLSRPVMGLLYLYLQAPAALLPWRGLPVPIPYEAKLAQRPGRSSWKTNFSPSRESNPNFLVVHPITKLLYTNTQNTYESSMVKQSQTNKMTHTNEQFLKAPVTLMIASPTDVFFKIHREITRHYVTG